LASIKADVVNGIPTVVGLIAGVIVRGLSEFVASGPLGQPMSGPRCCHLQLHSKETEQRAGQLPTRNYIL
jgi:hypothetical protein